MIYHRKCEHCNYEYEYEGYANLIVFCPKCHSFNYLECEYGYGPVVPCKIYLGNDEVGIITYDHEERSRYRYDSEKFGTHMILEQTYLNALYEAKDITANLLKKSDLSIDTI